MSKTIISEGKTTNEAIENGLKELKVSKNEVEIKVLENEDKRSFFSILAPRVVKVELTLKEDNKKEEKKEVILSQEDFNIAKNNVKTFLDEFLKDLNEESEYNIKEENNRLLVEIKGRNLGFLIGYRGETLYDLQNIISSIANKKVENRVSVILDIENYRQKREKTLHDLALKVASTVIKTRKDVTLEPMKPYERKIIHSALQDNDKVATKSIGKEPKRKVVISLK